MELQTFLNDRNFTAAVDFSLKLWHSIEYVNISKYEAILEYVTANLPKFVKHLRKHELDFNAELDGVLKLLALPYPMISVDSLTQQKLIDCLLAELKRTAAAPRTPLIEAVLTVLMHQNMKNYFKDNLESYGRALAAFFGYYTAHLTINADSVDAGKTKIHLETVFQSLNAYIKVIDMLPGNFKLVFYTQIMTPLCEFVAYAKTKSFDFYQTYIGVLRSLFFKDDNQKYFTEFFEKGSVKSQPGWLNLFDCEQQPPHVVLVTIEAFFIAYGAANVHCVKFLCDTVFSLTDEARVPEQLTCLNHFVALLVKYDVKIVDVDGFGTIMADIVRQHHRRCAAETMEICVSVIHFNKYLFEGQIFDFIADFMFLKKSDRDQEAYARFLRCVLNVMYETESAGQFVAGVCKTVKSRLDCLKLSKKLKRKAKVGDETPKKRKLENGEEANGVEPQETGVNELLKLVLLPPLDEAGGGQMLQENPWTDISFAWPHADVGRTFMLLCDKFRPTTIGHPIVNLLVDALTGELSGLSGAASENQLFLIDFFACLLSEFFAGSRIAEKAVKSRNQIANIHDQAHRLLRVFGNKLLSLEHNVRLMNSFLNLTYNYGNLEILLLHYLPDTFTRLPASEVAQDADRPNIDVTARWKDLYSYLSVDEWSTLEQRVINFGRDECKIAMNRMTLQKLRANVLFTGSTGPLSSSLILSSLGEFSQILPILEDPSTNLWFIGQLERQQKLTVADLILASADNPEIVRSLLENREFFEVLLISVYEMAAAQFHGKSSLLKSVDFDRANQMGEDVIKKLTADIGEHRSKMMKKYEKLEICKLVELLETLPLEYLEDGVKSYAFGLNLALFADCAATKDEEVERKAYNVFLKLLYNKLPQDLSKAYKLDMLLKLLPDLVKYQQFYDFYLFNSCKCFNAQTQKNFEAIVGALESNTGDENLLLLGLLMVQKMSQMTSAQLKQDDVAALLDRLVLLCAKALSTVDETALENTFAGFLSVLRYSLAHKDNEKLLGKVKKLLKRYVDHSIKTGSPSSKTLLSIFVKNPDQVTLLGVEKSTLDAYLTEEWTRFVQEAVDSVMTGVETPIKYTDIDVTHLIVLAKTEAELKDLLKAAVQKFNQRNVENTDFLILLKIFERLINLASRLDISPEKIGTIMSFCQTVIQDHLSALYVGSSEQNLAILVRILHCYSNSTKRQRIVVYQGNVDTILDVLLHVNIKKLPVTVENRGQFFEVHDLMSEILFNLVKKREKVIMNRVPQLLEVYKDLCRSICGYKADEKQLQLDNEEVMELAQLSHKLEKLTEHIISMGDIVKLVAPATLTHLIRIMISNKKSAALPEKIKKIFRNICYLWIKICNESASHLITRMCRDDVKNIYTKLCKEYEMYVKFKGKI